MWFWSESRKMTLGEIRKVVTSYCILRHSFRLFGIRLENSHVPASGWCGAMEGEEGREREEVEESRPGESWSRSLMKRMVLDVRVRVVEESLNQDLGGVQRQSNSLGKTPVKTITRLLLFLFVVRPFVYLRRRGRVFFLLSFFFSCLDESSLFTIVKLLKILFLLCSFFLLPNSKHEPAPIPPAIKSTTRNFKGKREEKKPIDLDYRTLFPKDPLPVIPRQHSFFSRQNLFRPSRRFPHPKDTTIHHLESRCFCYFYFVHTIPYTRSRPADCFFSR